MTRQDRGADGLGKAIDRMLGALLTRAAAGEVEALEQLARLSDSATGIYYRAIAAAHDGPAGYSYGDIGQWIGISRQAAHALAQLARGRAT